MKLLLRFLLVLMVLVSPMTLIAEETSDQNSDVTQSTNGETKKAVTAEEEPEPDCE